MTEQVPMPEPPRAPERASTIDVTIIDIEPTNEQHVAQLLKIDQGLPDTFEDKASTLEEARDYLTDEEPVTKPGDIKFGSDEEVSRLILGYTSSKLPDELFAGYAIFEPAMEGEYTDYITNNTIGIDNSKARYEFSLPCIDGHNPEDNAVVMQKALGTVYSRALGKSFEPGGVTDEDFAVLDKKVGIYAVTDVGEEEADYQRSLELAGMKLHSPNDGADEDPCTVWTVNPRDVMAAMQPPSAQQTS